MNRDNDVGSPNTMITVREATLDDVEGIRDVFLSEYSVDYAYPQYLDTDVLRRLIYADDSLLLAAVDESGRVVGTASVVFSVGSHNDLVGEFGRLVVHPDYRGQGIGRQLMESRIAHVEPRLHVGIVENRASHDFSQRISARFGFVPVGFIPMKVMLARRESVAVYVRHFSDSLKLRRNHPHIIPEASLLADFALTNCGLTPDAIIDDISPPYPHDDQFELEELQTEGYASLLRIQRGRLRHRDVFGPVKLHYGLFQLQATHSHYLIARRENQIAGGIGYMVDKAEKAIRVFELISHTDAPIRFMLKSLLEKCERDWGVEYIDLDVSAYAPRMQRTLLELGFIPVSYVPANVFHEVERLDAIRMVRLLVPLDLGELHLSEAVQPIADEVIGNFADREVMSEIAAAARRSPLLSRLSSEQSHRLMSICQSESFSAGEALYRCGDMDATMHLILQGDVQLIRDGHEIGRVRTGQCLGETSLVRLPQSPSAHSVNAIAVSDTKTASFNSAEFHRLVRRHPDIGVVVYRNLAADISEKLNRMDRKFED